MISLLRTVKSSVIDVYQFIGPAAKADLLRVLQGMNTVKRFHAIDQGFVSFCLIDEIDAGLVQCYRIRTC